MEAQRLAAIDVGSNAIRLRVVEKDGGGEVISARAGIRLGEDAFRKGELSAATVSATVDVLSSFGDTMRRADVGRYRAVATSATRESRNARDLVGRVRREAGVDLEVIDGLEEARLVRLAVERYVDLSGRVVLVDIGGGSTEVTTFIDARRRTSASLPLGTIRMLGEVASADGRIGRRAAAALGERVDEHLREIAADIARARRIVVTGGTARAFVRLCRDRRADDVVEDLRRMTNEERMKRHDLRGDRADTIAIAGTIVTRVAAASADPVLEAPSVGLRHGVIADLGKTSCQAPRSLTPRGSTMTLRRAIPRNLDAFS